MNDPAYGPTEAIAEWLDDGYDDTDSTNYQASLLVAHLERYWDLVPKEVN